MNRSPLFMLFMVVIFGPPASSAQEAQFVRNAFGCINVQRKQPRLSTLIYNKTLEKGGSCPRLTCPPVRYQFLS